MSIVGQTRSTSEPLGSSADQRLTIEEGIVRERRPWGMFERFTLNEVSTVKLLYLEENRRLSLQYHNNRSEFWKVIRGSVDVELGKEGNAEVDAGNPAYLTKLLQRYRLGEGDWITIPKNTIHRLASSGSAAVVLEIATGTFDEGDIVRLEDDYCRLIQ